MFDLETALAAWRRSLEFNPAFDADDLDELERHLRDQVAALAWRGVPPRDAFAQALREMGGYGVVETEYRKVYWGKRRRRRQLLAELTWRLSMLKNYAKIALRNVSRHKGYAFINVFGLAVGLAFCLLIFLHVRHEWSFDDVHEKTDQIYRIHRATFDPDGSLKEADVYLPEPLGPAFMQDFPEVVNYVRFWESDHFVRTSSDPIEETILFADPSIFAVFTFPLLRGDPSVALRDPKAVVLTESAARRYFGETDPLGKTISIRIEDAYLDFTVTGVAQDGPDNSSVSFEILAPFRTFVQSSGFFTRSVDDWGFSAYITYVLLDERAKEPISARRLLEFRRKYYPDDVEEANEPGVWTEGVVPATYRLQALPAIHLNPSVSSGLKPPTNPRYTYILAAIALAVLFIACINFMTLAIGRSAGRGKEIGVRKVVGALRGQLMVQFWLEAVVLSGLALVIGAALALAFLPTFNVLTGSALEIGRAGLGTILLLAVVALATGLLAGAYPAMVLSRFRPMEVLRNRLRLGGANAFTKSLLVVQFGLSVFLIACTLVMLHQLDYVRTKNLGFDKNHLVVIPTNEVDDVRAVALFRNELAGRADIEGITATTASFARGGARQNFEYEGEEKQVYLFNVESNYVDLMGLRLVAGRAFDPNRATDSTHAVIVNEAFVRDFGLHHPIGQTVAGMTGSPATDPVIVGVLKDYNYRSLETGVAPLALRLGSTRYRYLLVRIAPGNIPETIQALQATWQRVAGDLPFQYTFLDDDLDAQYRDYARWSKIVAYAAGFAILIACLGLFGLSALMVSSRRKEIGIRKVLGASVLRVTSLLSKEFALLVLLAFTLATPGVYVTMHNWLGGFAYRIELSWVLFAAAGVLAFMVAMMTVSFQAIRAALADPVESLRYE